MKDQPGNLSDSGTRAKSPAPVRPEGRRSFIYVMIFFGALFTIAIAWWCWYIFGLWQQQEGNGRDPQTYGFDLSNFTGDASVLVGSGQARDQIPAISNPTMVQAGGIADAAKGWSRVVVSDDVVIGVVIDGEARAYPLRYMQWHEVVNDAVGPQRSPIVITYNKLCDSAVVFSRRVHDEVLSFGHSGLLYNSNLLMYDSLDTRDGRGEPPAGESLWSQLAFKAMTGPLSGAELTVLPMYFGPWNQWVDQHPQTLVWGGEKRFKDRYNKRVVLPDYFAKGELKFPVKPLPPPPPPEGTGLKLMDRVVADGGRVLAVDGSTIEQPIDAHACWFAWYAFHGPG